jgi:hypothetical protein
MKKTLALAVVAILAAACGGKATDTPPADPVPPATGEPNGTPATATALALGTPRAGALPDVNDYDFYAFTVPAGGATVRIQTFDRTGTSCSAVDTFVEVYDASAVSNLVDAYVTESDDTGIGACEDFPVALPEGTNYVAVSGWLGFPFDYTVKVSVP